MYEPGTEVNLDSYAVYSIVSGKLVATRDTITISGDTLITRYIIIQSCDLAPERLCLAEVTVVGQYELQLYLH